MKAPITQAQAWAMIAESAGWNAKELPALPEHDHFTHANDSETIECFRKDQLQAYGAACAAHAREMALSEAMQVCKQLETAIDGGGNTYYRPADARQCVSAIEVLKGK